MIVYSGKIALCDDVEDEGYLVAISVEYSNNDTRYDILVSW